MLTCDQCGALVDGVGAAEVHGAWHTEINEAFLGTVVMFERITKTIEALSESLENRQTD